MKYATTAAALMLAASAYGQDLYVGTAGGPFGQAAVYRYAGGTDWENISGDTALGAAVMHMIEFRGELYAATQSQSGYGGWSGEGRVWRHDGGASWTQVGTLGTSAMVLLEMDDTLYCGTSDQDLYRYEGSPDQWTKVGSGGGYSTGFRVGVTSEIRGEPEIFLGELDVDAFHRYNPNTGLEMVDNWYRSCVFSMKQIDSAIYAGCWHGSFYRTTDGNHFEQLINDYSDHIWAIEEFQGRTWVGTGASWSGQAGKLMEWNGSGLVGIHSWPASVHAEGVSALATDGARLFIGLGVPDGYYNGDGTAEVWSYDGRTFERLCAEDFFGAAVQCMLTAAPRTPALTIREAVLTPNPLKPGDSALLVVRAEGVNVTTSEAGLKATLQDGWSLDPIVGPDHGRGVFAAAIALDCHAAPGDYSMTVHLEGTGPDGATVASDPIQITVSVRSAVDTPGYGALVDTILELRAFDMNLEDAGMPPVLDLRAFGIPLDEVVKRVHPGGGEVYSAHYGSTYNQYSSDYQYYWSWPTSSFWLISGEYSWSWSYGSTSSWSGTWSWETRAFATYTVQPPEAAIEIASTALSIESQWAWPQGLYHINLNDITADPATLTPAQIFEDAGDGTIVSAVPVMQASPVRVDLAPVVGAFRSAFDMIEESSPFYEYDWSGAWGSYSYSSSGRYAYLDIGSPELEVTFRVGLTPETLRLRAVEAIVAGSVEAIHAALLYLNDTYGLTADERGLRRHCDNETSLPLVIARNDLALAGNAVVEGDAHSDGLADAAGNARVAGVLSAVGNVRMRGGAVAEGGIVSPADPIFPTLEEVLNDVGSPTVVEGDVHISGPVDGVLFVHGNVHVSANTDVRATIVATGDITVTGQAHVASSAAGWALYTAGGKVRLAGNARINGRVAGASVAIEGNGSVQE